MGAASYKHHQAVYCTEFLGCRYRLVQLGWLVLPADCWQQHDTVGRSLGFRLSWSELPCNVVAVQAKISGS